MKCAGVVDLDRPCRSARARARPAAAGSRARRAAPRRRRRAARRSPPRRASAAVTGATSAGSRRALATRSRPTCPCSQSQSNVCGASTIPSAPPRAANASFTGSVRSPVIPETFPTWAAERFSVNCPMALVVSVPLNTMLADLDETLRALLKRELERHGFDGVEIAFDAPAREWSASSPRRPSTCSSTTCASRGAPRRSSGASGAANGRARDVPAAAAHGVLVRGDGVDARGRGRAPAALAGARRPVRLPARCPTTRSPARSPTASQRFPLEGTRRAAEGRRQGRLLDAVGGQYKASLDYVVDARVRVRHRARARARGADADASRPRHADGPARDDRRDAPRRRHGRRRRRRAASPTRGSCCPSSGWSRHRTRDGPLPLRPRAGRHAPLRRPRAATGGEAKAELDVPGAGRRPRGRRASAPRRSAADRMGKRRLPERLPCAALAHARPDGELRACSPRRSRPTARAARQPRADGPARHDDGARGGRRRGRSARSSAPRRSSLQAGRLRPDAVVLDLRQADVARAGRARPRRGARRRR